MQLRICTTRLSVANIKIMTCIFIDASLYSVLDMYIQYIATYIRAYVLLLFSFSFFICHHLGHKPKVGSKNKDMVTKHTQTQNRKPQYKIICYYCISVATAEYKVNQST